MMQLLLTSAYFECEDFAAVSEMEQDQRFKSSRCTHPLKVEHIQKPDQGPFINHVTLRRGRWVQLELVFLYL